MINPIWTPKEEQKARDILTQSTDLWFPKSFGFDSFSLAQVRHAVTDPTTLQFRLNKVKGRGILYGVRHAELRRELSNIRTDIERTSLWQQRLTHAGIWPYLQEKYRTEKMLISDIGMGHTVLHVYPPDAPQAGFVLKQEELPHHRLFCQILKALGWANIESDHHLCQGLGWQITPYISGNTVSESACFWPENINIATMAQFAALGDMLGREDRHNENYILGTDGCLPIDTAALYGTHNEDWIFKYVAGGLYEISTVAPYLWQNPQHGQIRLNQFLESYTKHHDTLSAIPLSALVSDLTKKTAPESSASGLNFIQQRQTKQYTQERVHIYKSALAEMIRRMAYRKILDHIWQETPSHLSAHPTLKMYALAHESRLATFFLAEERPWIFETLRGVAHQLGLEKQLQTYRSTANDIIALSGLSLSV